ncbi:MAG: hypothetical protein Q4G03_09530 [Planctomycetia bacterium]|nr:hypothetical protein [Planctomycetia bacterium]
MKKTELLLTAIFVAVCFAFVGNLTAQGADLDGATKLKLLYSACKDFKDANGCYPPAYLVDANGVKGDDWFALLQPYLNAQEGSLTGVAALIDPRGVFVPAKKARLKKNGVKDESIENPENLILFVELSNAKDTRKSLTIKEFLEQLPKNQSLSYITADGKIRQLPATDPDELLTRNVACVDVSARLKAAHTALYEYYDREIHFPALVTVDENGKEISTWREPVAKILSTPSKLKVKDVKPEIAGIAPIVSNDGVFTGKPNEYGADLTAITDGLANTVFFVELPDPESTKTSVTVEEFYNQLQNCPEELQGYYVGMGDGSIKFIKKDCTLQRLKALVSRAGDEMFDF